MFFLIQSIVKKSNQLLNPLKAQSLKSIEIVATIADLIFFHCMLDSFFSVIARRPFFDSLKLHRPDPNFLRI